MDLCSHFASSIFNVVYGLDVKPKNDPYLVLARGVVEGGVIAGVPGAFLVDMLPICKISVHLSTLRFSHAIK